MIGITSMNDGGSLFVCENGTEHRRVLNRGDVIVFRGDLVHAGTDADDGHFGRIHVYLDSREVVHNSQTFFADCATIPIRVKRPRRVKKKGVGLMTKVQNFRPKKHKVIKRSK